MDAAEVRLHLADQLYFAVARQVDWMGAAAGTLRSAYEAVEFPVDAPGDLAVNAASALHDVNPAELYRSVRRRLEQAVLGDTTLAHEFRLAVLRLCQFLLGRGDVDTAERDAVLGWLQGEKVPAAALRSASIYGRIGRHSARAMLVSLARWLATTGSAGLVLDMDLARLAVARRPPLPERDGVYYSKPATLDAYEVVRQLIDATDALSGMFAVATLPPQLLTDEARGLPTYSALQLRVADEVRDRRRANPYASLVRLDVRVEAVP